MFSSCFGALSKIFTFVSVDPYVSGCFLIQTDITKRIRFDKETCNERTVHYICLFDYKLATDK